MFAPWETRTNRSTRGAAPTSATFLSSSRTFPKRRSFAWSRTIARRKTFCRPRRRWSPTMCGLQNVLRRAIILLQANDLRLGKVLLELKNVADVRPTPGVDRLILVSHGANIVVLARQHAHEFVLGAVGVLVLVDQ